MLLYEARQYSAVPKNSGKWFSLFPTSWYTVNTTYMCRITSQRFQLFLQLALFCSAVFTDSEAGTQFDSFWVPHTVGLAFSFNYENICLHVSQPHPPWILSHVSQVFSGVNLVGLLWSYFYCRPMSLSCSAARGVLLMVVLFCRPTVWAEESPLRSKPVQERRRVRGGEPRRICLSLSGRFRGPHLRLPIWLGLPAVLVSGGTNLRCGGAREHLICLVCFISVGRKQEMAHLKWEARSNGSVLRAEASN